MVNLPKKPKKKRSIYLDHAATTYVSEPVKKIMLPFFSKNFGNPSSLYDLGREANGYLNEARRRVAAVLQALSDNIIFTAGGTESDNLAILGTAKIHKTKGNHIITTKIEHHAVLHSIQELEKDGFDVTYLPVNEFGQVGLSDFKKSLRKETILVSIMYANNEIGTIEPISEIGKTILRWRKEQNTIYPYFHTDACQAAGSLDLDVEKLHVDLLTINGSKIYGPKGIGVLYKRRGIVIKPIIFGGGQEFNLRSGTENLPAIMGLAKALELSQQNRKKENKRLIKLREYFWKKLQEKIPKIRLNGPLLDKLTDRLPNNLNISILDIEGEALLLYLNEYGIMCSTGSACTSTSLEPSHVLLACGLPYEYAHGSLRFSLGLVNTKQDIDYVLKYLPPIVEKLREISPVNLKYDSKENTHAKIWQR